MQGPAELGRGWSQSSSGLHLPSQSEHSLALDQNLRDYMQGLLKYDTHTADMGLAEGFGQKS